VRRLSRDRELAAAFGGVADSYGRAGTNLPYALLKTRARARLLARVPRGGLILDAACGTGRDAAAFAAAGRRVAAFDLAPGMVRVARRNLAPWILRRQATVRCMRFQDAAARLPGLAGQCDGVWCHWGTNFSPSLAAFAACCRWALRPGGVAVFTTAGRWPVWEIAGGLLLGDLTNAFRRRSADGVRLAFGGRPVTAWAPPLGRALAPFRRGFVIDRLEPLGLLIPPPALWRRGWGRAAPLWRSLSTLESALRPLVRLADHALVIVCRE